MQISLAGAFETSREEARADSEATELDHRLRNLLHLSA